MAKSVSSKAANQKTADKFKAHGSEPPAVLAGDESIIPAAPPSSETDAESKVYTPPPLGPQVVVQGFPGGTFNIVVARGGGFGTKKGMVLIGGREIPTTRWDDGSIRGYLPRDIQSGSIQVTCADGTILRGVYLHGA